jgi:hypothetical protein
MAKALKVSKMPKFVPEKYGNGKHEQVAMTFPERC